MNQDYTVRKKSLGFLSFSVSFFPPKLDSIIYAALSMGLERFSEGVTHGNYLYYSHKQSHLAKSILC